MEQRGKVEITTHADTQTADFLSGDKVICVDTNWQDWKFPQVGYMPRVGEIHCIRGRNSTGGLLLVGVYGPLRKAGEEAGFLPYHFRRVHR